MCPLFVLKYAFLDLNGTSYRKGIIVSMLQAIIQQMMYTPSYKHEVLKNMASA